MPEKGFDSFLQYGYMVAPGVMHLKSGAYLIGWLYRGPDVESSSVSEQENQSYYHSNAHCRLSDGWMSHQIIVRAPSNEYPSGHFDEVINRFIDGERHAHFTGEGAHFEIFPFFFLTYLPPAYHQEGSFLSRLLNRIGQFLMGETVEEGVERVDKDLKYIGDIASNFEMSLTQTMDVKRLKFEQTPDGVENDMLLHALNMVINQKNHPCGLPDPPIDLDSWLARDCEDGEDLIYDGQYVDVGTIEGFPPKSMPNMLVGVEHLPIDLTWSNRSIICDDGYSRSLIDSIGRKWKQKTQSMISRMLNQPNPKIDHHAVNMHAETEAAAALVEQGIVKFGHFTSTVVLRAPTRDELQMKWILTEKLFEGRGFKIRRENRNRMEAFLGSFPGHGRENVRKPFIHTLNIADMAPNSNDWAGKPTCPCPPPNFPPNSPPLLIGSSVGTTPFRFNLHVEDVGHTLVLGPTGAGKSTLLATIASQWDRYPNSQIFCFDKGYSMYALTKACKSAIHYDLGAIGTELGGLCPLADIDSETERSFAVEFIDALIQLQLYINTAEKVSARDRNLVREALNVLASSTERADQRTMTHFISTVQSNNVRDLLRYYQFDGSSPGGMYLDGTSNDLEFADMVTFEIESLMGSAGDAILIPVLLFLFHQIEKRLKGRPTLLIIDEAWLALSKPFFAEKIKEWLKVFRKANCSVILATQQVSDLSNSPLLNVLVENCPTKVFLPNPEAKSERSMELYRDVLGLNDTQINLIATGQRKRQYYYVSPYGKRLFDLNLGPIALSIVGAGAKEDIARIRALSSEHKDIWVAYWLAEKLNSRKAGEKWLQLYNQQYGTQEVML